jgi:hypothetical protein
MTELAVPRTIGLKILDDINFEVIKEWKNVLADTYNKNTKEMADVAYGGGKTVDERFNNLPKEVQDAILSTDYQSKLMEIGKKNGLNIEEVGKLDMTTTQMMLGAIHPEDYGGRVEQTLAIPKDRADAIAQDVNEKILKNIRTTLISHTENMKKVEQPEPKVPLPPYKKPEPKVVASAPTPNYTEIKMPFAPDALPIVGRGDVFQTAGIDVVNNSPIAEGRPMTEQTIAKDEVALSNSGVNLIEKNVNINTEASGTRESALSGIENPPNISAGIIGAKFGGIVASNAGTGAPHGEDKYREQI